MRVRRPLVIGCCLAAAISTLGSAVAAPTLGELSAAAVAREVGRDGPAIVVLWSPDCLACRKSLAEIERFGTKVAGEGPAVRTVVPQDEHDEARELLSKRGLTIPVAPDADRLDAASRRILLDQPIAYAVDRKGEIVGARAGLLGAWVLDELAAKAVRPAE